MHQALGDENTQDELNRKGNVGDKLSEQPEDPSVSVGVTVVDAFNAGADRGQQMHLSTRGEQVGLACREKKK